MEVLVVGGGGREHAIIKKLKENPAVEVIYALPGNGGMAKDAVCVNISALDIEAQVAFAKENGIDFAQAIMTTDTVMKNTTYATVIDGKEVEMHVEVGQKVIYSKYAGTEVKYDGEEYIIVKQNDILAVVEA